MDEIELQTVGNKENNQQQQQNNSTTDSFSVEDGKNAFNNLEKQLELESQQFRLQDTNRDIESGGQPSWETEEDFKLRKYFEGSHRQAMENGGKPKKMGVSVRNLTVVGRGADVSIISDMMSPLIWFASWFTPSGWDKKKLQGTTFDILHDVTGFCKDGEMLLVLGRPGAGCSTLLRLISNQRTGYVDVKGNVNYGGIPSEKWSRFRGESIYTPEEDIHFPTLTVRQTLDFTLKCKTPGNRLPEETKRSFRTKIFDLLLSMFGIVHQADTIVGDEFIRGLSGGERKRLTITEAMVSSASITCWDCSTRGLDAASALDYAKSLRIMSDTLNKTTIASFYQASDSIYNLFDKVMILEKGRCIYFGPGNKAKQYFLDLGFDCEPRKSVPDFLTGVTNPQERLIRPGFEGRAPETSADFESAWKSSQIYQDSLREQEEYERQIEMEKPSVQFVEEVEAQKSRTNPRKSAYTTSYFTQVRALTIRQCQLIWGDQFSFWFRYVSIIVQSLIYGSVFFQLDKGMNGLFTRGGAIFSAILFNAFLSEGEIPMTFVGRRIIQKHRSYALYRPSAFHLAQVVTDIPVTVIQVFLFSFMAYFMFGLDLHAGKFFIFNFALIGVTLAMTNFFRVMGNLFPSVYFGQNISNFIFIFLVTYSGYMVPYEKMHPWFQWFFWINPFGYNFKSLMVNEFDNLSFDCNNTAIPFGPGYDDPAYRVCPIEGATPGSISITGERYLDTNLSFNMSEKAISVVAVYIIWIIFTIINMVAVEYIDWTSGGYTHKVYKKGKAPKMNDLEQEKQLNKLVQEATSNMKDTLKMRGGIFTWQNIKYTVPVKGGDKLLLDDVEGWIKPGQMTALMGSSGAGKTTLLDVLAKRKTIGVVEGKTRLNGKPLEIDFERITGYVEQMDVHNPNLTVRESLRFSARLRQEPSVSIKEKYDYVERVLEMMEMKHLGDALIGDLETEYILEAIGAGVHGKTDVDWPAAWKSSPECAAITEELGSLDTKEGTSQYINQGHEDNGKPREFANDILTQLKEVYFHMNLIWWRDPYYSFGRFVQAVLVGLVVGFTFYDLKNSSTDMKQRIFFIFEVLIFGILLIFIALPQFFVQRDFFRRDYASKFYSWFPFALSIVIVELPYLVVTGTLFFVCSYWTSGIQFDADTGFYFWFIFIIFLFFCVSFGLALGAVSINLLFALTIFPIMIIFLFLFCGIMVPPQDLPHFWRSWVYKLNPCTYFLEGILTNILKHVQVKCTESDLLKFTPPPGLTCNEYTANFTASYPIGKIEGGDTTDCGYCIYTSGEDYYKTLANKELINTIVQSKAIPNPIITILQEQYIDTPNYDLMKQNVWIKYQDQQFIAKQVIDDVGLAESGSIKVKTFNDDQKTIRSKYNIVDFEQDNIYASFLIKRYQFSLEDGIKLYVDCAFYEDNVCVLYGSIKTTASNVNKLDTIIQNYNLVPSKSKIIHYIEIYSKTQFKDVKLPENSKNNLISPLVYDHDPLRSLYL
eukprot:gene10253-12576_t